MLDYKFPKPTNREQKRKLLKEIVHCYKLLEIECEVMFAHNLFNSDRSYDEIYTEYLNKWQNNIHILKYQHKLRLVQLPENHFSHTYKPLESI